MQEEMAAVLRMAAREMRLSKQCLVIFLADVVSQPKDADVCQLPIAAFSTLDNRNIHNENATCRGPACPAAGQAGLAGPGSP